MTISLFFICGIAMLSFSGCTHMVVEMRVGISQKRRIIFPKESYFRYKVQQISYVLYIISVLCFYHLIPWPHLFLLFALSIIRWSNDYFLSTLFLGVGLFIIQEWMINFYLGFTFGWYQLWITISCITLPIYRCCGWFICLPDCTLVSI
jgi:hypothetical protein